MPWIQGFIQAIAEIHLAPFDVDALLQKIVTGMQPPPFEKLVRGGELQSIGVALEVAMGDKRKTNVRKTGLTGCETAYVIVIILKKGNGGQNSLGEFGPITEFKCNNDPGNKVRTAVESGT